jgi:hypothetical protein
MIVADYCKGVYGVHGVEIINVTMQGNLIEATKVTISSH